MEEKIDILFNRLGGLGRENLMPPQQCAKLPSQCFKPTPNRVQNPDWTLLLVCGHQETVMNVNL
jgi:hypothetical protein